MADQELLLARVGTPLRREQVEVMPEIAFSVFHRHKTTEYPYAILFKFVRASGHTTFLWFRSDALICEVVKLWRRYRHAVTPLLMSPEDVLKAIAEQDVHARAGTLT